MVYLLQGTELKREMKNAHYNKEITLIEISVYHNIIATGSSNEKIYI
jgi:hypothetical protein